jgi:glucose 1-dehydrogenase
MFEDLKGKVAVITGASSGIGRGIAIRFAQEKMKVVIGYSSGAERARETVDSIQQAGGEAIAVHADVASEEEIKGLIQRAVNAYGRLDIMVNNAGIESSSPSHELNLEEWNRIIQVNLTGVFLGSREALKVMKEFQIQGSIINISSVHQKIPKPSHIHYSSSKGGVRMLTESLAAEYAHLGIRVNAIAPGAIHTHMNHHLLEEPQVREKILNLIPMKQIGKPEQIASAAAWLASEESSYVTGVSLYVDGGMTLYPTYV